MSMNTIAGARTELNRDRRTVPQLLAAAAKDSDAASVFYNGTGPADYDSAIIVVKGRENVDYVVAMLARQQLVTPGKPVEDTGGGAAPGWLLPEDAQALKRFCETCEDSQPYDVPKDRMRRLAELGVIQWSGGARYSITAFGQHVLDLLPEGWPRLPLKTQADHDADSRAALNGAHGSGGKHG